MHWLPWGSTRQTSHDGVLPIAFRLIVGTMPERYFDRLKMFVTGTMGLRAPDRSLRADALLAVAAGAGTAIFATWLFYQFNFDVMCRSMDIWLDSDSGRIIAGLNSRTDESHSRAHVHPLWGIGVALPFILLRGLGLVSLQTMSAAYVAICAFAFAAALYTAFRLMRLSRTDSVLGVALCLSTSATWLWIGLPELFFLGAFSLLVPLIWMNVPRGIHDQWSGPLQSLVSLSITVTNWAAGLLAAWLSLGLRRAFVTAVIAFAAAGFISVAQYLLFPEAGAFFNIWKERWADYGATGSFLDHVRAFFLSTIAAPMPDLREIDTTYRMAFGDRLSRLQFAPVTHSPAGITALVLWGAMVARGLIVAWRGKVGRNTAFFVVVMVIYQFALHAVYGIETFLYSPHFLPFLTIIAAWSLLSEGHKTISLAIVIAAITAGMLHNAALFQEMAAWYNALPVDSIVPDPRLLIPAC